MDTDDLMGEIYAAFHAPALADGEFTISMYADKFGLAFSTASRELERAVKDDRLEYVGERILAGRKRRAYRRRG